MQIWGMFLLHIYAPNPSCREYNNPSRVIRPFNVPSKGHYQHTRRKQAQNQRGIEARVHTLDQVIPKNVNMPCRREEWLGESSGHITSNFPIFQYFRIRKQGVNLVAFLVPPSVRYNTGRVCLHESRRISCMGMRGLCVSCIENYADARFGTFVCLGPCFCLNKRLRLSPSFSSLLLLHPSQRPPVSHSLSSHHTRLHYVLVKLVCRFHQNIKKSIKMRFSTAIATLLTIGLAAAHSRRATCAAQK